MVATTPRTPRSRGWRDGGSASPWTVVVARQAAQTISRRGAVADLADQWGVAAMAV